MTGLNSPVRPLLSIRPSLHSHRPRQWQYPLATYSDARGLARGLPQRQDDCKRRDQAALIVEGRARGASNGRDVTR
jgi:hypothetical protein